MAVMEAANLDKSALNSLSQKIRRERSSEVSQYNRSYSHVQDQSRD